MITEDPRCWYAATMNHFVTVHHADRNDRLAPGCLVEPVNPVAARRPQVGTAAGEGAGHWPLRRSDDGVEFLLAAAERARVLYPEPVAALIHREIHAYLEIGERFGGDTRISRLAEHLLGAPEFGSDASSAGPRDVP